MVDGARKKAERRGEGNGTDCFDKRKRGGEVLREEKRIWRIQVPVVKLLNVAMGGEGRGEVLRYEGEQKEVRLHVRR